ncbi:hypothetical protein PRIC2_004219 [Phytophthora ramorum]
MSERHSSLVLSVVDNAEAPTPDAPPSATDVDKVPLEALRRGSSQSSRRHSSQVPYRVVYPIAEATGEATNRPIGTGRRRSVSTRGIAGTPNSAPPPTWATLSSGLRRSVSDIRSHTEAINRATINPPKESPYEEMMARFQIRQLQRTPSSMTLEMEAGSTTSRGFIAGFSNDYAATPPGGLTARTPRAQARNTSDHVSSVVADLGPRTGSFLYFGEQSSFDAALSHPPLESGTSSAQLTEQLNLARGGLQGHRRYPNTFRTSILGRLHEWKRGLAKPLSPYSKMSQARYATILVPTVIYVLYRPLQLAFPDQHQHFPVDAVVAATLGLDVLMTLHTGYVTETGAIILSHWLIIGHYAKTRFVLDLLVLLSLLAHVSLDASTHKWISFAIDVLTMERLAYITHFVRMIWAIRANQSGSGNKLWAWLLYSRYSHLFRIAGIVVVVICIAHYIACIWALLLDEGNGFQDTEASWSEKYSSSFYAALLLMQGEGVPTDTAAQNMFASLSVVLGSIVLAVIFGHVAVLVADFNANTTGYQRKREEVYAMTAKLQLPVPLRERIHEYYEHLWHEYECLDGEIVQFSKGLSHSLGLEVVLFKYMEVVMHVPFWKDCTPDFQKQLMLRLDVRVYLPNDFIMRQGEVDDEFYMVNRGYCELGRDKNRFERVTTTTLPRTGFIVGRSNSGRRRTISAGGDQMDDGPRQSTYELDAAQRRYYRNGGRDGMGNEVLISRGQAFGDMALLMNYQRAADVRAVTHVEMCVLSRDCFQAVLTRYPDDRRKVVVDMLASYMQSYEVSKARCPLLELVRKVYSAEAIEKACAKVGGPPPLLPPVLTVRQAAERIYTAINVESTDATLKFGVGVNIRDKLVALRERRRKKRDLNALNKPVTRTAGEAANATRNHHVHKSVGRESASNCACKHTGSSSDSVMRPLEKAKESPSAETQSQPSQKPPLQERLRQLEERELVILQGLKELQTSFTLLRARQKSAPVPQFSRKRSAAGDDSTIMTSAGNTRVPLLRRVGSFVGVSSSSSQDNKTQGQVARVSPTRYADKLFSHQSFGPLSQHKEARGSRRQPRQQQRDSFRFTSDIEPQDSQVDSLAVPSEVIGSSAAENNTTSRTETAIQPSVAPENRRMLFQRRASQSFRVLEGAQTRTDSVPATKAEPTDTRRSTFQRTHSQSLRTLTEALNTLQVPRPSLTSAQNHVLRRMSSFVTDGGTVLQGSKRSPTRYADELFRRSIESPKEEGWEYK